MGSVSANAQFQLQSRLALKTAKTTSKGLNTDFLGAPTEVANLASQYDQVQFKNGQESVLLQRNNVAGVVTQSALNARGVLTAVPDVGNLRNNLRAANVADAKAQQKETVATVPAWQRWAIPIVGGAVLLVGTIFVLRRTG